MWIAIPICSLLSDEDLRSDRQPEFYQLDIEMSFATQEDLFALVEKWMQQLFSQVLNVEIKAPFLRLSHAECMEKYGSDKPDLRYGLELKRFEAFAQKSSFSIFLEAIKKDTR